MYRHQEIEKKWQQQWQTAGLYQVGEDKKKPKYYVLDMFPYPSGQGLHVGHPRGYIATDVIARYKMLNGFNVLHPMGWDAFGLPAENYALENKVHPKQSTADNIATYKRQLSLLGFTYDWSREINTTDPDYYKWTQWAFIQMFKRGLVYESHEPINWCPTCQTGLANEDVDNGRCERCGTLVEKKPMRQWVIKITDYAERLLNNLDKLNDWEEPIKEMQRNWIGKSEGAIIKFSVILERPQGAIESQKKNQDAIASLQHDNMIEVFTTRPDTIFGATYMVVCPEHELIKNYELGIKNYEEVEKYIKKTKNKSDLERTDLNKDKTGVELKGIKAINPATNEEIPIFVADYILPNYGTGAIMAVPAHDQRDWEFANKCGLQIKHVVKGNLNNFEKEKNYYHFKMAILKGISELEAVRHQYKNLEKGEDNANYLCFTGEGMMINSDFLNDLETKEATKKIITWLEEKKIGQRKIQYKLKDWVFSRQRYWGEPIPLIHCDKCGVVAVPEDELPLKLPEVEHYEPTGTGESPLANITEWVNTKCPKCGGPAKRETNTMPQWAGSSWYYLRYCDPHNDKELTAKDKVKYWLGASGVDCYVGGAEHATRHLIYARFWHKFLQDSGVVSTDEPFIKYRHVGLILADDGKKMSKRWDNVINPDDIVVSHGADALRIYEMFMGPFGEAIAWNTNGLSGARKFLEKVYKLSRKVQNTASADKEVKTLLHKTIKKVGEDIEAFKFNTAVSALMILVNKMSGEATIELEDFSKLLLILAPFAPHLAEELWQEKVSGESIFKQPWPKFDPTLAKDEVINLVVQINGKIRDTLAAPADIGEAEAKAAALKSEKVIKWLDNKTPEKIIYIKGRLINVVIK
jgi:leucyl-tRNA synthetase